MSYRTDLFQRDKHLVVDWKDNTFDVDPMKKHLCDACGTKRATSTLFKVFDTKSKQWFLLASNCFREVKKEHMPEELKQEARKIWEENHAD
ncbi:MAG TPA: hypothetical protein VNA25_12660 [Phycisphaerae bacterium]|nr:hypothetical protein [Phycisphaerae bacterium]